MIDRPRRVRPVSLKIELPKNNIAIERSLSVRKEEDVTRFKGVASLITSHVYVGDIFVAQNIDLLKQLGISCILNCIDCPNYFQTEFIYKQIHMRDNPTEDIFTLIYDAIDFIDNAVKNGLNILIHCNYGISRSSAVTIAYLMYANQYNYQKAFDVLHRARPICAPNAGFIIALHNWQTRLSNPIFNIRIHSFHQKQANTESPVPKLVEEFLNNDKDCYVIHTKNTIYIWIGNDCDKKVIDMAKHFSEQLQKYENGPASIQIVNQSDPHFNIIVSEISQ